jgi:hypothetical protein
MATYTNKRIKDKLNMEVLEVTAGKKEYQIYQVES